MALHAVGCLGLAARALLYDHILKAAGQHHHAVFLGVVGQVFLAFGLGGLAMLGALGVELLLLLGEVVLHDGLCLAVGHLQVAAGYHVLDCRSEVVYVHVACAHLRQLAPYAQA